MKNFGFKKGSDDSPSVMRGAYELPVRASHFQVNPHTPTQGDWPTAMKWWPSSLGQHSVSVSFFVCVVFIFIGIMYSELKSATHINLPTANLRTQFC